MLSLWQPSLRELEETDVPSHPRNVLLLMATVLAPAVLASGMNLDDVLFWAGEGSHRAAVVIDWWEAEGEGHSTVWGYRWDGTASGYDMLSAVVAADDRLYGKFGGSVLLLGLGYDQPGLPPFGLSDGTQFDEHGIAQSGFTDGATALDPADRYGEGWEDAYWVYAAADTSPYDGGTWSRSTKGFGTRGLTNGAWDGWTFTTDTEDLGRPIYPDLPTPATVATDAQPGDYNGDGNVNLADYTLYRDTLGSVLDEWGSGADGSGNGVVDAADYDVWRQHFGTAIASPAASHATVPEPGGVALILLLLMGTFRNSFPCLASRRE